MKFAKLCCHSRENLTRTEQNEIMEATGNKNIEIKRRKNEQVTRNSCVFQRPHPMWYAGQALRLKYKVSSRRQRVKLPKVPSDNSPLKLVPGVSVSLVSVSYTCKECQKSFDGQASLQRHLYNCHHALDMMPYQCEQCKKGFLHKSSYMRHLKQHEGIFNFTCQVCGKGFYNKSDLKGHLVSHGEHQEFTCVYCGRQFAYKQGLHSTSKLLIRTDRCILWRTVFNIN